MSKIGRNIPCPCGSGKKYKQCCLSRVSESKPGISGHSVSEPDQTSTVQKLIAFVNRPEFDGDREVAKILFWGPWLAERTEEEMQNVLQLPQSEIMFNAWLVFDMDYNDGRTLADMYLDRQGSVIPPVDRASLQQVMNTHIGLYEVEEVRRDEGFRLKDVWTESRMWVHERRATEVIQQWDLLAARLMEHPSPGWVMEVGAFQYPPSLKDVLLQDLKKEHRAFQRRFRHADDRAFFKRVGFLFCHWWLQHVVFKPLPELQTAEGDELVLAKVVFDIVDHDRMREALEACPSLKRLENDLYDWWEDGTPFRRTLGSVQIDAAHLTLETFSDERAERGRRLLEGTLGKAVQYRATAYEDVKRALEKRRRRPMPEPPSTLPPGGGGPSTILRSPLPPMARSVTPRLERQNPATSRSTKILTPDVDQPPQRHGKLSSPCRAGRPAAIRLWLALGRARLAMEFLTRARHPFCSQYPRLCRIEE